ncbi:MAG TPA: hypothetical protein VGC78_15520 [Gaiellaceae bacterium]|jgi:hypothetical protein
MDETDAVLRRLARIDRLRAVAPAAALLDELRLLLPEAEAWARAEGDARAKEAVRKLREEAEGMR